MDDSIFPHVKKTIEDFVADQEGNIPRNKVLTIGSMMLIMALLLTDNAFAKHRSHRSHQSHRSHSSGGHRSHYSHYSSQGGGSHSSHGSSTHSNHSSHSNHGSHSNHSNHASHSNAAPSLSTLNAMKLPGASDSVNVEGVAGAVGVMESIPPATTPIPSVAPLATEGLADGAQDVATGSDAE